jgi:hypothetical protein
MASMMRTIRSWRWCLIGAGAVFGIVAGTWLGLMTYRPFSGSIEDTFFRVHVGTGMHEAAEVLNGYRGSIDYGMVQGITKDGRSFLDYGFDRLPHPSKIDRFKLELGTEDGECITVDIGTGGRVTGKHFSSESWWQERLINAQNMIRR